MAASQWKKEEGPTAYLPQGVGDLYVQEKKRVEETRTELSDFRKPNIEAATKILSDWLALKPPKFDPYQTTTGDTPNELAVRCWVDEVLNKKREVLRMQQSVLNAAQNGLEALKTSAAGKKGAVDALIAILKPVVKKPEDQAAARKEWQDTVNWAQANGATELEQSTLAKIAALDAVDRYGLLQQFTDWWQATEKVRAFIDPEKDEAGKKKQGLQDLSEEVAKLELEIRYIEQYKDQIVLHCLLQASAAGAAPANG